MVAVGEGKANLVQRQPQLACQVLHALRRGKAEGQDEQVELLLVEPAILSGKGEEQVAAAEVLEPIYRAEGNWQKLIDVYELLNESSDDTARQIDEAQGGGQE